MPYDNTNRGAIFVNDRKETDKHPDRTGSINVEGVEYFLDGWLKETKDGKKFLSLSVKRKNKQSGQPRQESKQPLPTRPKPPAPPHPPLQYPEPVMDEEGNYQF